MPLQLASFYRASWDFTLYSEGFLAPWTRDYDDGKSPFISLEELMRHEVLDARYLSIADYGRMVQEHISIGEDQITPIDLANKLNEESGQAMAIISDLRRGDMSPTLESELDDLETWCHLGFYFAQKLQAGVALNSYGRSGNSSDKREAIELLERCIVHWKDVIRMTVDRYQPMPYVSMGNNIPNDGQLWPDFKAFHWKYFLEDVEADLDYAKSL